MALGLYNLSRFETSEKGGRRRQTVHRTTNSLDSSQSVKKGILKGSVEAEAAGTCEQV